MPYMLSSTLDTMFASIGPAVLLGFAAVPLPWSCRIEVAIASRRPHSSSISLTALSSHLRHQLLIVTHHHHSSPIHRPFTAMAYSNTASYTVFPSSNTSSNAFALFGQSPRDNYAMYDDLRQVLRPSNGPATQRQRSTSESSAKFSFKKMFGGF
ncbi:hypothetical protein BV25DRAFT_1910512 [Artomyces pyxidatus]|uniref:Uncharacterized protein n=1 Tax=Artomyces pyxidatus TaxID=48021 RepID=A0ACB8TJX1_9AGAM|nr:hypothetical protein BV25DRAFT_1910512 [Artomyces pyxidatus]